MHFQVQHKTAFEIPLSIVSNSNIAGKNEVAVEFAPLPIAAPGAANGGANHAYREPDELVEMRFFVPGFSRKAKGSQDGDNADGDDSDDEDAYELNEDGSKVTAAEAIHRAITEQADVKGESGDSLVVFEEILVLTPRSVSVPPPPWSDFLGQRDTERGVACRSADPSEAGSRSSSTWIPSASSASRPTTACPTSRSTGYSPSQRSTTCTCSSSSGSTRPSGRVRRGIRSSWRRCRRTSIPTQS